MTPGEVRQLRAIGAQLGRGVEVMASGATAWESWRFLMGIGGFKRKKESADSQAGMVSAF